MIICVLVICFVSMKKMLIVSILSSYCHNMFKTPIKIWHEIDVKMLFSHSMESLAITSICNIYLYLYSIIPVDFRCHLLTSFISVQSIYLTAFHTSLSSFIHFLLIIIIIVRYSRMIPTEKKTKNGKWKMGKKNSV